jgi:hypothetical protein
LKKSSRRKKPLGCPIKILIRVSSYSYKSKAPSGSTSKGKSSKKSYAPYDADKYTSADDFAEDKYEEFYDYEDDDFDEELEDEDEDEWDLDDEDDFDSDDW